MKRRADDEGSGYVKLRAVLYARVSMDRRGRSISVESQLAVGRRFCEEWGIEIAAELVDNDMSASRYAKEQRPEYERALRMLEAGKANTLWTWENSRAQRELDMFVRLRQLLIRIGGYWAYDERIYDMSNPDDRIEVAEDALDSEKESEKTAKRVRRGVESRAYDRWWHGPKSFGYRKVFDPDTGEAIEMVPHEVTGPAAVEIVERVIAGEPLAAIARDLQAREIPTPRGGKYDARQVRRIWDAAREPVAWAYLMDRCTPEQREAAALVARREGARASALAKWLNKEHTPLVYDTTWNGMKVRSVAMNPVLAGWRVLHQKLLVKGRWQPLISEEQHALVVARLGDPMRRTLRDGTRVVHLLSGIARCAVCEKAAYGHKREGGVYVCNSGHVSRSITQTDAFVTEAVLTRLESCPELFTAPVSDDEVTRARAEAQDLRARLDGFTDAAAEGELSPERLSRIERKLLPKIDAAERRVTELSSVPTVAPLVGPQAREVWAELDIAARREVLRAVVRPRLLRAARRGVFDPGSVSLTWLSAPGSAGDPVEVA
ncbi:recombinase family protein [Actinokineospora inagensis]|uniref:recombinase family protein n=1 Tax=Actinokineospora inagensis TaxID=103730 RepID=UPI000A05CE5C|nr:recombinase family protein [Actinokineospora inagensis]